MNTEILIFECDQRFFGLRSQIVVEVLRSVALSTVPQAPDVLLGVANLRGQVLPVLNTHRLLGFSAIPLHHSHHFVVVQAGSLIVALHVDRAVELARVDTEAGDDATASKSDAAQPATAQPPSSIEFIAKTDVGLVPVINPIKILSQQQLTDLLSISSSGTSTGQLME